MAMLFASPRLTMSKYSLIQIVNFLEAMDQTRQVELLGNWETQDSNGIPSVLALAWPGCDVGTGPILEGISTMYHMSTNEEQAVSFVDSPLSAEHVEVLQVLK